MNRNRALEIDEILHVIGKPKPAPKVKRANNPPIDKARIIEARYSTLLPWCECGCLLVGSDLHHCFIGRRKGYPILDDERNLVIVNHAEHISRKFDNQIWRVFFWEVQCLRYGEKAMREWVDAVLAAGIDKSRLDFLR